MEEGMSEAQIHEYTNIDPWFLAQLGGLHAAEAWLRTQSLAALSPHDWAQAKRRGFSDPQLATFLGASCSDVPAACRFPQLPDHHLQTLRICLAAHAVPGRPVAPRLGPGQPSGGAATSSWPPGPWVRPLWSAPLDSHTFRFLGLSSGFVVVTVLTKLFA